MSQCLHNVSAFSADNTNVNSGIHHNSVFTKLKEAKSEILHGNCHAHIVHNTLKKHWTNLQVMWKILSSRYTVSFWPRPKRQRPWRGSVNSVMFNSINYCAMWWQDGFLSTLQSPACCKTGSEWNLISQAWVKNGQGTWRLCWGWQMILLELTKRQMLWKCTLSSVTMSCLCLRRWWKSMEKNGITSVELYSIVDSFLTRKGETRWLVLKISNKTKAPVSLAIWFWCCQAGVYSLFELGYKLSQEVVWLFRAKLYHLRPLTLTSGKISFGDIEKITEQLNLVHRSESNNCYCSK